jgi:hypothetical protein
MKGFHILIVFFLFFVTCKPDSENIASNDGNKNATEEITAQGDPPKEILDINNLYNQVSLFIACRNSELFKNIQSRNYYINYKQKLDESWNTTTAKNLKKIESWKHDNNLPLDDTLPVFYPFSGPDFLYANAFFENSKTYILVGLENPGKLPNLSKMDDSKISIYLYRLYHSLGYINQNGYFTTSQMQNDFRDSSMNGIIHLLCFYLSKTNHHIGKITYVQVDNFGNEKEKKNFELESELINGLKIDFFSNKQQEYKTLYYFPLDLSDQNLKDRLGFIMFLNHFGLKNTFMKAASYLPHDENFGLIRDIILKQSDKILQDDSGIPLDKLMNSGLSVQLFGSYSRTIKIFEKYYQPALNNVLKESHSPELPFKLGYNSWKNEMVLMLARQNGHEINKPITYKTEKEGVVFKVQLKSSWKKIPLNTTVFKGLPKVDYYFTDNLYKYTIGNFSSAEACEEYRKIAAEKGFKDAFIVAFYQKNRISLEEADKIMKNE